MKFGLICEFRNPDRWRRETSRVYGEVIDHLCAAEELGFEAAEFLEHHFVDDGYIPSPLVAAAAVAARTKTMRLATNVALLPLYDPVRFAEDAAVVDAISNGRLDLGVSIGYRAVEYAGYRIDLKTRGARMDEAVQIVTRLLEGEAVTFEGSFYQLNNVKVTPRSTQKPRPPLWIGGFVRAAIRRAARYGDGYTGVASRQVYETYLDELRIAGKDPALARVRASQSGYFVVSRDPERTFNLLAPHVIYWADSYASWFEGSDTQVWSRIGDTQTLRTSGLLNVFTPQNAIAALKKLQAEVPLEVFSFLLAPPGLPVKQMFESLELFAQEVMPAFRQDNPIPG
jgi:alkanesulfonate monooxygenase SsuD/methylene tetrahydromethanopterin reductase-like flavin-dependent oxidoreductase (luciferase family)